MKQKLHSYRNLPALGWMGFIFYLSSQDGSASGKLSGGLSDVLYALLQFLRIPLSEETFHFLLRKGAHFTAYLFLGLLFAFWLEARTLKDYALCLFYSFLYALTDELHQRFVPGRSGELRDVFIDTSGAFTGLVLLSIVSRIRAFYSEAAKNINKSGSHEVL
ncbi:VanZ family protein [Proteiniclasticum ruminis]|uniref:VanZ family protein n=1 Tax=Proteiniclasticum ruminis TaxID=398199 RepID=UPI0028B1CC30|nr:VanZ family protein [Proteiniclasticum ruminis]